MPPKRRRTIIKPSTALDSLRAKIRSFADTADEEQLREVARLVDRLSISNSEPFRLFDLPYELLEYTAERYFTLEEAASFLSVNRVFSELFGNSTWKRLDFDDTMVDECEGSLDVLKKNLRRVRVLDLWSVKPGFSVSNYFPFATEIAFEVEDGREIMFTLHLEKMKCLRRVTLTITKMSHRVMDAAAKWVDDSHRSGHVQQIVIRVENSVIYRKAIHSMALLMDKIKSKRRIRLDCGSPELFPTSVIQFMPVTLTKLIIPQIIPRGCCGKVNKQVFGAGLESVFVHLHTLRIQVCCNKSSLYDFQSFVPERFPVLSYLAMYVPKQSCHGDAEIPLETIFYNKQWPSVTDLELVGNETKMPEVGRLLLRVMPALHSCIFRCMDEVDIASDLNTCLTISRLTLLGADLELSHLQGKLACLVYLELGDICIDSTYLQLIASCKRLVEIKLIDCSIHDDAIAAAYSYPCSSIRKVVISEGNNNASTKRMAYLLPAFPNIRVLDLADVDVGKRMNFIFKCPAIKILTKKNWFLT